MRTDVEVTDWPLVDLQRFQRLRPTVYAQMTTRLMTIDDGPSTPQERQQTCDTWRKLQTDGKAASLPVECGGSPMVKAVRR